ncbi:FecR family protein [Seonamhaeicola marinus]|uniref:DUF4974 domain-containing protein n=1 Tax=Seonamhaeicola marinus TaxID=1912246 RepID=A0A5D0HSN4_9FLAO|nr:FecR domain-containing protein [Seonamhaeicola marinus]TYA74111.1 DUF4974 domain-containing protein [Seonamhaeicola marinus]
MNIIKRIIKISKSVALNIIHEEPIDSSDISNNFSDTDTSEILEKLTNDDYRKERDLQIKSINKTKNQDWNKVSPYQKESKSFTTFFTRIAAAIVLCFGLAYYFSITDNSKLITNPSSSISTTDTKAQDHIVLELGNGKKEIITADGTRNIVDESGKVVGVQKGANLNYKENALEKEPEKLVYNKLTIPYGKVFQITLSDNTIVHLNAGSSIRYPVKFIKGENRDVFLEGEAFFDVTENKEQPFIVHTNNMNVEVLGTKFNVSSYPEDPSVNTVLVEGAVTINSTENENKTLLKPGHKADWKKENGNVVVNNVDTRIYTAWIDGKVVFEHMVFKNILKKLERHYNVSITNTNTELANETFTASFDIESIDQVLLSFSKNYEFTYEIKQDQITIN